MKTCSDSLKALLHQYRTGERKTWYIADLYTIWINNSEKIDKMLSWNPYLSGNISYANAKFGLGLYDNREDEENNYKPLIRSACPPRDFFDWTYDDWTVEYFVRYTSWLGDLGAGGTQFAVTDSTRIEDAETVVHWGFTIGAVTSAYVQDFCFWSQKVGEEKKWKRIRISQGDSGGQFAFKHVAVSKKGNTIYTFLNGVMGKTYTFADGEVLAMPTVPYMNISGTLGNVIMDEVRVSNVARYTANFSVPTERFSPDGNAITLLHLDGNLKDEGEALNGSLGEKDFRSGEIFLYTGHDTDLLCGGNKYQHIAIEHGDIAESRGTETATMDLTINYNPTDTITPNDERTWFKALKDGIFDKAYISLDRLYSPIPWRYNMPNIPIDYVLKARFFGRMDVQEVRLDHANIQVKSPSDMLTRELPRNLVKPSCLNHFGDFMCQVNPESFRRTVSAQAGSSKEMIVTGSSYADGYYDNGLIYSTSGKNKGQFSSIKTYSGGNVTLFKPFTEDVNVGDTFDILCGCDKTMKTCDQKYGNLIHFRGCPFLPCKNVLL
jgi:uncharacterized phage protein (TIGR02218 family)